MRQASAAGWRSAGLFCALLLATCCTAIGQTFPVRPISIVCPYGAGSGNDMIARELAQKLTEIFKSTVIVDNKPGATGNIATDYVAQSKPDGYTLFLNSTSGIIYQATNPGLKTDIARDLAVVGFAAVMPYVIAVPPSFEAHSVKELIGLAQANPGKINYNGPPGSMSDYLANTLKTFASLDMVMIPYKSTSDAQVDVLANRIQVWITTAASAVPFAKSGKVRALAVTGENRLALIPDVPTIAEAGIPQMQTEVTFYLMAPKGVSPEIVQKLNEAVNDALTDPALIDRLALMTVQPKTGTSDEATKHVKQEITKWTTELQGVVSK